ncbi:MAG TPA: hypothetical protein PLD69_04910 [Sphaerochaeta sp.]|nr:hypothetical protein [Sphaerochaeta sp.]HPY44430.1 hypothetical protein [Sphaerochaeta sp.]HQB05262.1 hypothetical protein [Sphaerochaeta sp.]
MKHVTAVLLLMFIGTHVVFGSTNVELMTDCTSLISLFGETISARIEARLDLSDEFALMLPVELMAEKGRGQPIYLESGLFLAYHPFSKAAAIYASLIQLGILFERRYGETKTFFLNEVGFGYTFRLPFGLLIEPRMTIKDPNSVFTSDYQELKETFSSYPMIRFALYGGWSFTLPSATT